MIKISDTNYQGQGPEVRGEIKDKVSGYRSN